MTKEEDKNKLKKLLFMKITIQNNKRVEFQRLQQELRGLSQEVGQLKRDIFELI